MSQAAALLEFKASKAYLTLRQIKQLQRRPFELEFSARVALFGDLMLGNVIYGGFSRRLSVSALCISGAPLSLSGAISHNCQLVE
jgi:hypothetical protein